MRCHACPLYLISVSFNQKKKKTFETRFLQKNVKNNTSVAVHTCRWITRQNLYTYYYPSFSKNKKLILNFEYG